jgi:DNA polymerase III epsilon subunit-like protein
VNLVFLDTETTGLDPFKHELLEVGMIVREPGAPDREVNFSLKIDIARAEGRALEVNGYFKRHIALKEVEVTPAKATALFTVHLDGALVVGNNPQFDLRFIEQFLYRSAAESTTPWYYHPVDLKALVAAHAKLGPPPWSTPEIAEAAGVPIPRGSHTALVDARWNRDVYDNIYGRSA